MKYDFDTIIDRKNTNSAKWDYFDTQLPMWVEDMDFKVTGTTEGVTALQMDMKVHGLPVEILEKAIKQSHEGRMFILEHMLSVLPKFPHP